MPPNSVMYRNKEKIEKKNRRIDIAQKKKKQFHILSTQPAEIRKKNKSSYAGLMK